MKANADYNARLRRNEISQRISDLLWKELKAGQVSNLENEYNKNLLCIVQQDDMKQFL